MYISVVLGCADKDDSFTEATRLMSTGFSGYTVFVPELPNDIPYFVKVKRGMIRQAAVECGEVRSVVLPNGAASSVSAKVIMPEYVYAPIEKGDKIGEVHFTRNDKMMFAVDIVATESAESMNLKNAIGIILKKLLTF